MNHASPELDTALGAPHAAGANAALPPPSPIDTASNAAAASFGPAPAVAELIALVGADEAPLLLCPGRPVPAAIPARTVVALERAQIGSRVLVVFEGGDPRKPIVVGVLADSASRSPAAWPATAHVEMELDSSGERVVVSARRELVLRCGQASITLTAAGKVLIQGSYVLSRSSGTQRIKGGSVQIN